jgi:uncharacterized protein (DUF2267 family)
MVDLDWDDREKTYLALRTTLQALRDRLPPEEAAELAAQLPMLVRGFYYEGWRPTGKPVKERHKEEFLAHIDEALTDGWWPGTAEEVARSVFGLLARRVSEGEIADIRQILPKEIRELFEG